LVHSIAADDYIGNHLGFEGGEAEIATSGLQGIEEETGGFRIDLTPGEEAHDLHERDLDRIGILEDGQGEIGRGCAFAIGVEFDLLLLRAFVEEAETVAGKCGRSALGSVDFQMLATGEVGKKRAFDWLGDDSRWWLLPLPRDSLESGSWREIVKKS
jgi:hypothetical protein